MEPRLPAQELTDPGKSCIVCCALSGVVADRKQCPAIPYTPEEYAAEARRAWEAGATVVHIHARRPDGTPSYSVDDYRAISEAVKAACPVLLNFSTGAVDISTEEKIAPVRQLRPHIAALNMGSMNYAKFHPKKHTFVFEFVFANPFSEIVELVRTMKDCGVRPEMECFDTGHVANSYPLIQMGLCPPPRQYSLILGVTGGISPTVGNLLGMVRQLPDGSEWQVIGISDHQWRLVAAAVALGGNVRVGLEDNFYVAPDRMAKSNGELVEKAVRMIRDQGREPASLEQTKARLGIPDGKP
ncbi:MAG: 3-keto-5-aminohexanoate cleavage protein [Deltaproteobacteria bacterium]|nr:MAG: 3-keto-5-aminohexanoate cleavage protein [Deltaproteobacteria bacterium]